MKIGKIKVSALAVILAVGLAACDKPRSAEEFGRKIDQATSSAGKNIDQATSSAGKNIDQATQNMGDQAARAGAMVDDAAITAKIKNAIMAEPGIKVLNIHVDTLNGAVILTGIVTSKEKSDLAKKVASSVSDVKSVDNQLIVRSVS